MRSLTTVLGRRLWTGFALLGLAFLASCQTETVTADQSVRPTKQVAADSTRVNDDDPPVKPGGPGGGK